MFDAGVFVLNLIMTATAVWIVQKFWSVFWPKKKMTAASAMAWAGFAIFQMLIMYGYGRLTAWAPLINILLLILIVLCAYQGTGMARYFLPVILCVIWAIAEAVVYYSLDKLLPEKDVIEMTTGAVISKIVMIIGVNILSVLWRKAETGFIPARYFLVLLLFPIGSIYVTLFVIYSDRSHVDPFFIMLLNGILLLFNIFIFELYAKLGRLFVLEKEKVLFAQLMDGMSISTREKEKLMEEFREEKHNLINKLIVLRANIEGNEKDVALEYLNGIIEKCDVQVGVSGSGNRTVDALIDSKYAIAKELGIEFETRILIPMELPLDQCDLGILLGNSLDNAMEAVSGCQRSEKTISVAMGVKKGNLVLSVRNPFEHTLQKDNRGHYKSTKAEADGHGYGLSSIRRVARQYDGELLVESENDVFSLTVSVNLLNFDSK